GEEDVGTVKETTVVGQSDEDGLGDAVKAGKAVVEADEHGPDREKQKAERGRRREQPAGQGIFPRGTNLAFRLTMGSHCGPLPSSTRMGEWATGKRPLPIPCRRRKSDHLKVMKPSTSALTG